VNNSRIYFTDVCTSIFSGFISAISARTSRMHPAEFISYGVASHCLDQATSFSMFGEIVDVNLRAQSTRRKFEKSHSNLLHAARDFRQLCASISLGNPFSQTEELSSVTLKLAEVVRKFVPSSSRRQYCPGLVLFSSLPTALRVRGIRTQFRPPTIPRKSVVSAAQFISHARYPPLGDNFLQSSLQKPRVNNTTESPRLNRSRLADVGTVGRRGGEGRGGRGLQNRCKRSLLVRSKERKKRNAA